MRARNLKPGYFTNEHLVECDPLTRILFAGLWCMADKAGRLEDRPKKIKMNVLPCDDCDVDAMLAELARRGLIRRYQANGKQVIDIPAFVKHQNPHHREKDSELPAFPEASLDDAETRPDSDCNDPDPGTVQPGAEPCNYRASPAESSFLNPESGILNPPLPPPGGVPVVRTASREIFPIPEAIDTPMFRDAWGRWKAFRKDGGDRFALTSIQAQLDRLAEMGPERAVAAINYSIAQGYKGIVEDHSRSPPFAGSSAGGKRTNRLSQDEMDRLLMEKIANVPGRL